MAIYVNCLSGRQSKYSEKTILKTAPLKNDKTHASSGTKKECLRIQCEEKIWKL